MTPRPTKRSTSTFTKAAAFLLLGGAALGAAAPPTLEDFLANAALAIGQRNPKRADFWIARYLARKGPPEAIQDLLDKRRLNPAGFLSDTFAPDFLDWFEKSTHALWAAEGPRVQEGLGAMEIAQASESGRFVAVVASPELQSWFTWSAGDSAKNRRLLLAPASASGGSKIYLYSGKRLNNKVPVYFPPVELDTKKRPLQYVWKPEFHDLDGDGAPEVWLRYNLLRGNGFTQALDIFSMNEEKGLVLVRRFQGEFEGIARRLDTGEVEEAAGTGSKRGLAHLEFDQHRIDTWEFKGGSFSKKSRRFVDHILKSDDWKKYY
ncbi:MAG TPA: hypothetical protein VL404_09830 [Candidatus Eisenbacteria bacterium]|nr:hypothetical protein [Candidatus Eisenbacteria bacterium]